MIEDNSIRKLLLHAEETAPKAAWEFIEQELNQSAADIPVKNELLAVTENVPAFMWDNITDKLDDAELGSEILKLETEVPHAVWDHIYTELEETETDSKIAAALLNVTEKVPDEVWQKIERDLYQQRPAKIIQINSVFSKLIRVAAVLLVVLATWSIFQLLKKNKTTDNPIAILEKITDTPVVAPVTEEKTASTEKEIQKEAPTTLKNPVIKNKVKIALKESNEAAINAMVHHEEEVVPSVSKLHYKTTATKKEAGTFIENEYLLVLNEAGDLIRVSKKISTMKCAKQETEIPVDAMAVLQNRNCDEQIKRWQEKMAYSTSVSPSTGFIDINDLFNSIEK